MLTGYILADKEVVGYRMPTLLELSTGKGNRNPPRKISKYEYVTTDGEIKEYEKHSINRSENLTSIKNTMKSLRRLIQNNFFGKSNELWVTLTYAENQTDNEQVTKDFKVFMKKLRRRYSEMEYLVVLEPQKRGAWHLHVLFKQIGVQNLFIPFEQMSKLWGHGYVYVKKLRESDNVAAYVTAYLTNVEVDGTENLDDDNIYVSPNDNKRYIKGGRLHLYPRNMRFYRASKGIKKPEKVKGKKRKIVSDLSIEDRAYLPDGYRKYDLPKKDGDTFRLEKEYYKLESGNCESDANI
ncbi:rolling circle replication-associated protein [Staphylococcus hominis]|uniref:rolling circle replication-associated protein n=1 Tax=Staphylococcus hominis TaxID=1290 RepID=UPI003204A711